MELSTLCPSQAGVRLPGMDGALVQFAIESQAPCSKEGLMPVLKPGDSVTNRLCPAWGTGVVLSVREIVTEVQFSEAGKKRVRTEALNQIPRPARRSTSAAAKADPEYESQLKSLVAMFRDNETHEGAEAIESSIYEVFLGGGAGKPAIKRQLARCFAKDRLGRYSGGHADAKNLYDFLFPEKEVK
jgi:hypothetical protein